MLIVPELLQEFGRNLFAPSAFNPPKPECEGHMTDAITVDDLRNAALVVERLTKLERRTLLRLAIEEISAAHLRGVGFLDTNQAAALAEIRLVASSTATAPDSLVRNALIAAADLLADARR